MAGIHDLSIGLVLSQKIMRNGVKQWVSRYVHSSLSVSSFHSNTLESYGLFHHVTASVCGYDSLWGAGGLRTMPRSEVVRKDLDFETQPELRSLTYLCLFSNIRPCYSVL